MKKIPSEILIVLPDYLPLQMVEAFQIIGYGAIPQWTNTGCSLFVYMDTETINACRRAEYLLKLELLDVDGFPLIRLDITIYDRPDDPLRMDCFFNITSEYDMPMLEALSEQQWVVFHWYNEDLKYICSTAVRWPEKQRKEAKLILEKAREMISRKPSISFMEAKTKYMMANPL